MQRICYLLLATAMLSIHSGCLVTHATRRVLREGEARRQIHFESATVAKAFQQKAALDEVGKTNGSSASFSVPFLLSISRSTAISPNAHYNDQLSKCDANGDGFISESEVVAYTGVPLPAPQHFKPPTGQYNEPTYGPSVYAPAGHEQRSANMGGHNVISDY